MSDVDMKIFSMKLPLLGKAPKSLLGKAPK